MTFQKVFSATSTDPDMRSEFEAWSSIENGQKRIGNWHKPIGLIETEGSPHDIRCALDALGLGWRLLAPPARMDDVNGIRQYDWWFVKES